MVYTSVASCMDWDIRLLVDGYYMATIDSDYGNLYIKDELAAGRVEVCLNGSYGPVCHDPQFWNNQSVSVVCSQLGFSPYGELVFQYVYVYEEHMSSILVCILSSALSTYKSMLIFTLPL